jgi:hypothetical protein
MGNTGSKKSTSEATKKMHKNSWERRQTRKLVNAEDQREREISNRERHRNGQPTPWETAQLWRAERRLPLRAAWLAKQKQT